MVSEFGDCEFNCDSETLENEFYYLHLLRIFGFSLTKASGFSRNLS